jgi:hypothetical protein
MTVNICTAICTFGSSVNNVYIIPEIIAGPKRSVCSLASKIRVLASVRGCLRKEMIMPIDRLDHVQGSQRLAPPCYGQLRLASDNSDLRTLEI